MGRSQRSRTWLRWIVEQGGIVELPTPVLVEVTTGDARDADVNRVVGVLARAGAILASPDEITARRAGALRYRTKTDDVIDALVAAAAVGDGTPCVLLTSDPGDLGRLLADEPQVVVTTV